MATLESIKARCAIDPRSECWEWQGCVQANGYGRIRVGRKTHYVHRLMLELKLGAPVKRGLETCHECDNRRCCNPEHLFAGTRAVNVRDMVSKGRHSHGARHSLAVREALRMRPWVKLTMDKARDIRGRLAAGEDRAPLAAEFGVDVSLIGQIARGRIWKEVGGPLSALVERKGPEGPSP